ncbi:LysR family transcriptional regulator [Streptomyces phaeochromogenes]|uniref:LysR family transcriptional regulator n=2 Tax=Streptomyces phaeochromogenes TaxID=1923 RepID=A0ABZ1HRZ5_STRPH|nr:LysR family transcriptional regulator [Streptomyces phaeochromogenes]MCX5599455.1 LysR family transcriptional regulator [Streptomyces phaeochromogenes]WRZ35031.1 LysR family transcriptional regulator [Streptomyces phaeochromogenes]WSD20246.1 LysR family transcriptional regulator [Streptomyces phaeochromogenes]WSJ03063.1 LysR family transcriptional regulator [Streptomyces phaeochromogenes]WSS98522.1 LysR family transcriptional regulator [Streptomyces phaeochromogenes]
MELRHLQHFVAVAEDQHFTRAAERLMVSQSGLSASIRALERELRAPLFVRTTRRVTLTEAGRALLTEAERILAQVRAAQDAVAAVQGVLRGTLSLGTEQCIAGVPVAQLLAAFRRQHPDVEIRLRQAGSGALAEDVAAGRLDLAFAVTTRADTEQLRCLPLTSEPMTVLCHPSHRLATGGPVTPDELGGEPFVDFHPDWGPRRTTDAAFAAAGVHRTVALEVNDVHSLLDLVEEGLGIAVVPRHFAHKRRALPALPLKADTETPYETVAMLPPPEATSPAARALMSLLETGGLAPPQEGLQDS